MQQCCHLCGAKGLHYVSVQIDVFDTRQRKEITGRYACEEHLSDVAAQLKEQYRSPHFQVIISPAKRSGPERA